MSNQKSGTAVFNGILSRKSKETVSLIAEQIENGEADPAYVGVALKKFAKIYEDIKKHKVNDTIEDAIKKYQEGNVKTFDLFGAKITVANTGYWDFSMTEDPMLEAMEKIEKDIKEQIKLRKTELQNKAIAWEKRTVPVNGDVAFGVSKFTVDFETIPVLTWEESVGQVDTYPPVKKGKETLRFSL